MKFSLLRRFIAAGMAGRLQSVEDSVAVEEADGSPAAAAKRLRPRRRGDPRATRRWIRRRVDRVRLILVIVIGLFPDLYAGTSIGVNSLVREGLARLPHPLRARDRAAGSATSSPYGVVSVAACGPPIRQPKDPSTG